MLYISPKNLFEFLKGSWRISRDLGQLGKGTGVARFVQQDDSTLLYTEDLQIQCNKDPQQIIDASQTYYYHLDETNQKIYKTFLDNKLFYDLHIEDPTKQSAFGYHLCQKDHYSAFYNFKQIGQYQLTYDINGPQKKQQIITDYLKYSQE